MSQSTSTWEAIVRPFVLVNPRRRLPPHRKIPIIAFASFLAGTVFYVDTFTDIHGALATLYVITLLLSAEILTDEGMLLLTGTCVGLSAFSYAVAHGLQADLEAALRLSVAVAALLIACVLIIRNQRYSRDLIKYNAALKSSEERYRTIFERSRVALVERDYSWAHARLMALRDNGVTDFHAWARKNPDIVTDCIFHVSTVAANTAALELFGDLGVEKARSMPRVVAYNDDTFLNILAAMFNGATHFEGEGRLVGHDGAIRLVLLTVAFPDDAANFSRVTASLVDITEREMAQKALFDAQAELALASRAATVGALSASLAHELNQPLGALAVNAQTLLRWLDRDPPDIGSAKRAAERIIRDSARASNIIHSTRSMLDSRAPVFETVAIVDLVKDTHALLEADLTRHGIRFEVDAAPEIPEVEAVRIELQQVLINLINNAIQAMAETPQPKRAILIRIDHTAAAQILILVRDAGPGLTPEIIGNLFKPFHTTKANGLGMGLTICRSMLEARGGSLTAANHPGGGALFEITIPIEANCD